MFIFKQIVVCFCRTAGSILGAGASAFLSDWDKISTTVLYRCDSIIFLRHIYYLSQFSEIMFSDLFEIGTLQVLFTVALYHFLFT